MSGDVVLLGINGSPRRGGQSRSLLAVALKAARTLGVETKVIDLYDYRIEPCLGCVSDGKGACGYPCVVDDDMRVIYEEVLRADGMILATPVYWYAAPGHVKNFVDRLTALENMIEREGRRWVEGKVAGVIAVGNDSGALHAASTLVVTFITMGFLVPPWGVAVYTGIEPALKDYGTLSDAANVGLQVARAARALKASGVKRWYEPRVGELVDEAWAAATLSSMSAFSSRRAKVLAGILSRAPRRRKASTEQ